VRFCGFFPHPLTLFCLPYPIVWDSYRVGLGQIIIIITIIIIIGKEGGLASVVQKSHTAMILVKADIIRNPTRGGGWSKRFPCSGVFGVLLFRQYVTYIRPSQGGGGVGVGRVDSAESTRNSTNNLYSLACLSVCSFRSDLCCTVLMLEHGSVTDRLGLYVTLHFHPAVFFLLFFTFLSFPFLLHSFFCTVLECGTVRVRVFCCCGRSSNRAWRGGEGETVLFGISKRKKKNSLRRNHLSIYLFIH